VLNLNACKRDHYAFRCDRLACPQYALALMRDKMQFDEIKDYQKSTQ